MKKYKILMPLLLLGVLLRGQEVEVEFSFFDIGLSVEEIIARSDNMKLSKGQWTDIDRAYKLPRFKSAMNYIVLDNRTDLLSNLLQISAYYEYLDSQPVIQSSGIKWQQKASDITYLLSIIDVGIAAAILYDIANQINRDEVEQKRIAQIIVLGASKSGNEFINGTASKKIVEDITKNFFSPLIKGTLSINDPFEFDAKVLYREQFIILQSPFYNNFNAFDKRYIIGPLAEKLAGLLALDMTSISLILPKHRLYIGLKLMGYSEKQINEYISKLK